MSEKRELNFGGVLHGKSGGKSESIINSNNNNNNNNDDPLSTKPKMANYDIDLESGRSSTTAAKQKFLSSPISTTSSHHPHHHHHHPQIPLPSNTTNFNNSNNNHDHDHSITSENQSLINDNDNDGGKQPKIIKQQQQQQRIDHHHRGTNAINNNNNQSSSINNNSNGNSSSSSNIVGSNKNNGTFIGNLFPIRKWNGNTSVVVGVGDDGDNTSNRQHHINTNGKTVHFNNNNNNNNGNINNNNNNNNGTNMENNDTTVVIPIKNKNNNNNHHGQNQQNQSEELELIWRHLSYTVSSFKWKAFLKDKGRGFNRRRLLNSISGSIRAGELMAIMGPSGAGKTTLIECISGRRRRGVEGEIFVTNCTKRTKLAYMAQDDAFMPCLTVFETLLFASKLRNYQRNNRCKVKLVDDKETVYNATTFPDSDLVISLPDETYHKNLVNQIIHKLGLDVCCNVKAENCSGGQQKRLCIALELIHSPKILILDEPTSGLDSVSCLQCVSLLRELAHNSEQPMAIAASIHQPTARILQNFDRLYVLANNGQCMYDGPTDQLVQYLAKFKLSCPTYHNPADFVLEVASGDYGQEVIKQLVSAQCQQHQTGCLVKYDSNIEKKDDVDDEIDDDDDSTGNGEEIRLWPEVHTDTISIQKICQRSRKQVKRRELYKTIILWIRCMLLAFRDPTEYLLRLFSCVSIILLNIILYNDSNIGGADGCSQDSVMHMINTIRSDYDGNQTFSITNSLLEGPGALAILNFGFIFFAMMFVSFLSMMPVILTFPMEVGVFYKEYFNGWYSFSSYFLAKNLTNLLPAILLPILYGATTYLITHQYWEPWRFLYFIWILVMIALVADGVGITISALFVHNVNAASIFAATSQIPLLLFTGLLVQIDQLPRFLRPFTYLSYYRLFFESAIIIFYGYGRCQKPEPFDLKKLRMIMGDDVEEVMDCVWQNTNFFETSSNEPSLSDRLERILTQAENQNPSLIMQNFHLKDEDLTLLMALLGSYAILSRVIAYIVLYHKANTRR